MLLLIGIDDTDSRAGGCTTYVAYKLVKNLKNDFNLLPRNYPHLVRLNPNIPYKTKGNGAVKIEYEVSEMKKEDIIQKAIEIVKENSYMDYEGTDPAIAFSFNEVNEELYNFYLKALTTPVTEELAIDLAKKNGIKIINLKESSKKGIVGALAALGAVFLEDYTYELLIYRVKENFGKKRRVDPESVKEMDVATYPFTFNNYDYGRKRVLITPHGPDPVLAGIRGEDPKILLRAFNYLRIEEQIEGWMLFITNQGTDAHFTYFQSKNLEESLKPFNVISISGKVSSTPIVLPGGHVKFKIETNNKNIEVICFKESGELNDVVRKLKREDEVVVLGGTREVDSKICINLEKLEVLKLVEVKKIRAPVCPNCNVRCKKKGKRQGYECEKCGFKCKEPEVVIEKRELSPGIYLPDPASMRHLTKPLQRYRIQKHEKKFLLVEGWLK
ncbi:MAG: tRNA(Ile)(2)-agmatinylcytidine synthase [Thermoproteota archaeon]|nr:DUF1743 domain-containing protein [Candidatus Brockarchaeota archaeon]